MPFITVNGCRYSYEERGDGLPLILLHGFPLDRRVWRAQLDALARHCRVITPDLRGFGQSAMSGPFSLENLADDIQALMDALGARPGVLGGLSMGGYVAFEFARKYPTDLAGLVLVDTKAEADTTEAKANRQKMADLALAHGSKAVADQMEPRMLAPSTVANCPQLASELRQIMEACPAQTIAQALMAMCDRDDHRDELASYAFPTLVLVGDGDALIPVEQARGLAAAVPNGQLAVITGAGHMTPMEQPEQVNGALIRFIDELKSQ